MATLQVYNNSSVTSSSTKNVGGVALNIGSGSHLLTNRVLGSNNDGVFGSTVVDSSSVDKALANGVLAYNHSRPLSKRATTSLSTVSNSVLLSGAAQPQQVRGIHKLEVLRTRRLTTAIRTGKWNIYTGTFSENPAVTIDTLAIDNAANPSRVVPGRLVYRTGAKLPVQDVYKSKTN